MTRVKVNGLDKKTYIVSGGYGSGFWNNFLRVDLEELAAGNLDKAFDVLADVHDTAGMSFREYHGIDICVKLPDGAKCEAIQSLCDNIAADAENLTRGFSVVWDGSNHVARWDDEDAAQYWADQFRSDVAELDCVQSYDLDQCENRPYVFENFKEAVKGDFSQINSADDVEAILHEIYEDDDEWTYHGYSGAAETIYEHTQEERDED